MSEKYPQNNGELPIPESEMRKLLQAFWLAHESFKPSDINKIRQLANGSELPDNEEGCVKDFIADCRALLKEN